MRRAPEQEVGLARLERAAHLGAAVVELDHFAVLRVGHRGVDEILAEAGPRLLDGVDGAARAGLGAAAQEVVGLLVIARLGDGVPALARLDDVEAAQVDPALAHHRAPDLVVLGRVAAEAVARPLVGRVRFGAWTCVNAKRWSRSARSIGNCRSTN